MEDVDRFQLERRATGFHARMSLIRASLAVLVILCGLLLRSFGFPLGLPALVVKYGGSLLWGTMDFLVLAALLPRLKRSHIAAIATSIAILLELFRLVHTPWLDAFRLTTAGALLLGRIFSLWNMLAYAARILMGVWLDRLVTKRCVRCTYSAS